MLSKYGTQCFVFSYNNNNLIASVITFSPIKATLSLQPVIYKVQIFWENVQQIAQSAHQEQHQRRVFYTWQHHRHHHLGQEVKEKRSCSYLAQASHFTALSSSSSSPFSCSTTHSHSQGNHSAVCKTLIHLTQVHKYNNHNLRSNVPLKNITNH